MLPHPRPASPSSLGAFKGLSPPMVYGFVGCLIICGGCTSSGRLPWEKLCPVTHLSPEPTEAVCAGVCVCARGAGWAHGVSTAQQS